MKEGKNAITDQCDKCSFPSKDVLREFEILCCHVCNKEAGFSLGCSRFFAVFTCKDCLKKKKRR